MKTFLQFGLIATTGLLFMTACKPKNVDKDNEENKKHPPVETHAPHSSYSPAFEGQTRTFGIKTKTELTIKLLSVQLQNPWGIVTLPNGNLLITQKNVGTMLVLNAKGEKLTEISGLPAVNSGGQGGLMDVILDPDFESNRMIYWTYAENGSEGTMLTVAKGRMPDAGNALSNIEIIYHAAPSYQGFNHYGGRLTFDNQQYLFISTGERYDLATRPLAQKKSNALGKILRITKDGQPAPSNPFVNENAALPELYSLGHRNPLGIFYDKETNQLWESEMGPMGGDEINLIEAGKNYGWLTITYGLEYNGNKIGDGLTQSVGMEQPIYYWDPSVSPSAILLYSGKNISEWKGNLLVACLGGQQIIRLKIVNNRIEGEEHLLDDEGQRFRAITEDNQGRIYAVTDGGRLYQISKKE